MTLEGTYHRLELIQSSRSVKDTISPDGVLRISKGLTARIDCALFLGPDAEDDTLVSSTSNLVSARFTVRKKDVYGTALIDKTISSFSNVTFANWANLTASQFSFDLTAIDTNQSLPSSIPLPIYYAVTLSSASHTFIAGSGTGEIVESGVVGVSTPLPPTLPSTTIGGNLVINGTFSATGAASAASLALSGNETVGGTLGVTGNTTVGGTLGVTGAVTAPSLALSGNETIGGTLGVTGNTTVGGTLGVTGNIAGSTMTLAGPLSFTAGSIGELFNLYKVGNTEFGWAVANGELRSYVEASAIFTFGTRATDGSASWSEGLRVYAADGSFGDVRIGSTRKAHSIIYDGDSLFAGNGGTPFTNYMNGTDAPAMLPWNGVAADAINVAQNGWSISDCAENSARVNAYFNRGNGLNLVVINAVTGTVSSGHTGGTVSTSYTPAQAYTQIAAYSTHFRSLGFKVMIVGMLSRGNYYYGPGGPNAGLTWDQIAHTYNSEVQTGYRSFADWFVNPQIEDPTVFGANLGYTNATYYQSDQLHPTELGKIRLANIVVTHVNNLIATFETPWVAPSLQNSWTNFGGGYTAAAYRKTALGKVEFQGLIGGGTGTGGTLLFTLPALYRPPTNRLFITVANNGTATNSQATINIDATTGQVTLSGTTATNWLSLENISFATS